MTSDREAIRALAHLYGRGVDARSVAEQAAFDACLTEDVEVDYGEFGAWRGLDTHKQRLKATVMDVLAFTHHLVTNGIIAIDGDSAHASYRVTAAHGVPDGAGGVHVVWGGATYEQDCVRTPQGWRIARHYCGPAWTDDGGGMRRQLVDAADVA